MVDLKSVKPEVLWYVVGLIVTDGNLSKDGRHINITSKDRTHLVVVQKALGINNKIGKKARDGSKKKIYSQIQLGDVKFYKYLLSIGLTQRKSLTLGKIAIDTAYFFDFLRGVIDGDGSISTWIHRTNSHRQWSLRIVSGSPEFLQWLKNEIENRFEVKGRMHIYQREDRNNLYLIKFGKLAAKIIIGSIYYKDCLSLQRKNLQGIICLQDRNRMINYGGIIGPGAEIGRQSGLKIL